MIFADCTFPEWPTLQASTTIKKEFVYLRYFFLVHLIKKKKKGTAQDVNDNVMIIMEYSQYMLFIFA